MRYEQCLIGLIAVFGAIWQNDIFGAQQRYYGEPVELKSRYIYFTSWKYVRQGSFGWKIERGPDSSEAKQVQGAWLQGDSSKPARFATVALMPPGERIRLNATVKPTGYIKVAVCLLGGGDVPGRSFEETDRMIGDDLAMGVSWKGELTLKPDGAPVILRFQLKQARLFGIEFY